MVLSMRDAKTHQSVRERRRTRGLGDIVERFNQLPVLDDRNPDDIVGYDQHGLPS